MGSFPRGTDNLRHGVSALLVALLLCEPAGAFAATPDHPMLRDRYFFSVGVLSAKSNTQASLNSGTVGVGTFIDFENDLGLDERDEVAQFMFRMRLSYRWQFEAEYFRLDRENERSAKRTLEWGPVSVPVSASVRSAFEFEDARLGIGYSFFRSQDKEVGFGLGVHYAAFEASLRTQASGSAAGKTSAPLPTITVYANVALTDRWLLATRVDRLSLDLNDIDGSVTGTGIDFVYQPWRNFNIGLGYRDVFLQISSTGDDWRGRAQVQQSGPLFFVGATF